MYEVVSNPIPKHDLWATKTIAEIQDYIEQMPSKQRFEMYNIMMYTLNACHKLVETEILNKEIFGE
jgi:hypothetical protein